MTNFLSLELQQKPNQNIKQLQRLIMSKQMQQAIHFLQMPIMELTTLIDQEMEQNPVLEYSSENEEEENTDRVQMEEENQESEEEDSIPEKELTFNEGDFDIMRRLDEDFRDHFSESGNSSIRRTAEQEKLQTFLESSICAEPTLFEHLMQQVREVFSEEAKRSIAETIIGNFDENGFLIIPLQELAALQGCTLGEVESVLGEIQTFEPSGVGARSLKESLLIQLRRQGKEESLAYAIIDRHFDDLLHNRIPIIKKGLHCHMGEVEEAIAEIARLDLHPGANISRGVASFVVPDVSLRQDQDKLVVAVNDDYMPRLKLNSRYMRMLEDDSLSEETKDFIKKKVVSAKWLLRNLSQRNETLEKIANSLAKHQRHFFLDPQGTLVPLTMKMLAEELEVHESTVARAVSDKYIETPRGVLPLRSFFTSSLTTTEGTGISSKTVRDMVKEIIDAENKQQPLSDEAISAKIKAQGIQCARRTVAKYRTALKFGNAQQRRKF